VPYMVEAGAGIEPAYCALQWRCLTTRLPGHARAPVLLGPKVASVSNLVKHACTDHSMG